MAAQMTSLLASQTGQSSPGDWQWIKQDQAPVLARSIGPYWRNELRRYSMSHIYTDMAVACEED